jgi:hypothetical protein
MLMIDNYKVLEYLLKQDQKGAKQIVDFFLEEKYKQVVKNDRYTYAIGNIPIALVAHLDTVYMNRVEDIFYDPDKEVIWSPQGLGADDRAGVFAIIQIIRAGYRPHIIFTTDEEKGGVGAKYLSKQECPFKDLKYLIELDRRGSKDCVFYDVDNSIFTKYIESFGFEESWGTFSDISYFAPDWKKCAVNLSVGYYEEHSYAEHLKLKELQETIDKVCKMLSEKSIPDFEYIELDYSSFTRCAGCGHYYSEFELFPVKDTDGKTVNYCPDCMVDEVGWCYNCGNAFVLTNKNNRVLCSECLKEVATNAELGSK